MSKRTLADLRDHLFDTIERLKAEKDPMDVDRAQAVASVAKTILDSAKVEIGYMRVTDGNVESDFIGGPRTKASVAIPQSSSAEQPPLLMECLDCGGKFDNMSN